MPHAVHDREQHDGEILPEEDISDQGPDEGCDVHRTGEHVVPVPRLGIIHGLRIGIIAHHPQIGRHEDDEDALHSIETETFGSLVSDDERNATGKGLRWNWRCEMFRHGDPR